ncbi:ABC transporter ATP-binding protein [Telmatospirillum sp. J64-1]|uniref:ABC transporter ATP-binding protein n=1 Tax=Telmatospirillum sp. J64-1 TaxID=2502183 RepID=UPI001C8F30D1|nr:ABC transporter ATP-binding protein [Telmatospirillum sp. J64-1]
MTVRLRGIQVESLSKSWGNTQAVKDVTFSVESGQFLVLLGPSGCGKSTTLRMIAGLEPVSGGSIHIGGNDVTHAPPARRGLSMVFQSYALFPHLNVAENILFGLKVRKVGRAERDERLKRVADMTGLSELLARKPAQLSGGQRQRVALARAIIAEHPVCLMDEPLSNLDAKLRHEMRVEIRALQQRLGMTVIYVTHDQVEAMSMADKVVLMRHGRIEQQGSPEEMYARPDTVFTATFLGTPPMNLIELADGAGGAVIKGMTDASVVAAGQGDGRLLGVRPEHVVLLDEGGLTARAESADYHGADTVVTALLGSQRINLRVPGRFALEQGAELRLGWRAEDVHFFDFESGRRCEQDALPRVA